MTPDELQTDALVVGAGPAALSLVAALLDRGVETICVAPQLVRWAPTYGAWADELVGLDVPIETEWTSALVSFPRHENVSIERRYVKIDSAALFTRWSQRLHDAGRFLPGLVSSAFFSGDFSEIRLDSGVSIRARQVFDASGHSPVLVERAPMSPAYQVAFGLSAARKDTTLSSTTMGLMLWDNGLSTDGGDERTPAFYYEMPIDGRFSFREYTVLASRPMTSLDMVERRVRADHVSDEVYGDEIERCIIPMGYPVPQLDQLCVGFGGAASMVHPATGYMIARTLRTAPQLAAAYVDVCHQPAPERARSLWEVVWPSDQMRTHELYRFGLEAVLRMTVEETHAFFAAFFNLPDELWRPYQSGTATPREVAAAMWRVFGAVDGSLKRKLIATGFGPHALKLLRTVY